MKNKDKLKKFGECEIGGCNKGKRSGSCNWCEMHYYRNRRNGSPNKLNLKQYDVNHNIFENINDDIAWLIGLIASDGNVSVNRLSIKSKDLQLLEDFQRVIETTALIKDYLQNGKKYYTIGLSSKKIVSDLLKFNIVERKSLIVKYPDNLEDKFFWSFLRGMFDGDGSFLLQQSRKGQRVADGRFQLCSASLSMITTIKSILERKGIRLCFTKSERGSSNTMYYITVVHHDSLREIYRNMYSGKNIPCLNRKKDLFERWLTTERAPAGNPAFNIGYWDKEENSKALIEMYPDRSLTIDEISNIMGLTRNEIIFGARKLGLSRGFKYSKEEDEIILKHYKNSSWDELEDLLTGRNRDSIKQRASRLFKCSLS